jgi:uncharacterized protein (TIGR02246 family)
MRRWCLVTVLFMVPPGVNAQATAGPADSTAIMQALENWERAWEVHDPELAASDYSDDADWTNAFGMRRIGRAQIKTLLTEVFELPFVMAGRTAYEYHDLRFLSSETALLRSRALREGQELPDGTVEETRRTNHLRVFEKRAGAWIIISHLIGDERTPGQPR